MAHELQRLQSKHHHIVDLCLAGLSRSDIASSLGLTPEGVGGIINSPLFQEELARRRERQNQKHDDIVVGGGAAKAMDILNQNSTMAAETLVGLARGAESEAVKRQSANDILDKVFGTDKKGAASVVVINADKMLLLQQVLAEDKDIEVDEEVNEPAGATAEAA